MFAVVIPARDCEPTIATVVRGARRFVEKIVVVNDGSGDATHARAKEAGAVVLDHATSRGKGSALGTGLDWARRQGATHAVTMDGDGEHLSEEIPSLLEASRAARAAIVKIGRASCRERV